MLAMGFVITVAMSPESEQLCPKGCEEGGVISNKGIQKAYRAEQRPAAGQHSPKAVLGRTYLWLTIDVCSGR